MVKKPCKREVDRCGRLRKAGLALLIFSGLLFIMQGASLTGYATAGGAATSTNLVVAVSILGVSVLLISLSYFSLR